MSEEQEVVTYECRDCGETTTDSDNFIAYGEYWYCSGCYTTCDRCEEYTHSDELNYISDRSESWCDDCRSNWASYCDGCDTHYSHDTGFPEVYDGDQNYCEGCVESRASRCDDCDEWYWDNCACGDRRAQSINDYSYKPQPNFVGIDPHNTYFGIEVETEVWSNDLTGASDGVTEYADRFYLKEDGSIGRLNGEYVLDDIGQRMRGFEIVSHPYSFDYWHTPDLAIFNFMEKIRTQYRARSWDAKSSCGLHIHISRAGFSSGAHTHRFLWLIYGNSIEMSKLGGRKGSSYAKFDDIWKFDDYGRPYRYYKDKVHWGRGYSTERYSAVNTNNKDTIELRWFKGTLNRSGILSSIQLAHACVEYTRYLTVAQVRDGALRWDKFSEYVSQNREMYPDLDSKIARLSTVNLNVRTTIEA